MIVYLDMDGVVADFDEGFSRLIGSNRDSAAGWYKIKDHEWGAINRATDFWINLPKMPNADRLVRSVTEQYPVVKFLTSGGGSEKAFTQKPEWIRREFGDYETIVVENRRDKILYCKKDYILIDDHKDTIDRWNLAGGNGILYTDPIKYARK